MRWYQRVTIALIVSMGCWLMALIAIKPARVDAQIGAPPQRITMLNSNIIFDDSTYVTGTATVAMKVCWQDVWSNKAILIEARDTLATDFAHDSAAVKVTVYQVFPFTAPRYGNDEFAVLNSRANPDSTTKYGSSSFTLWDSLDIHQMDTACVYARNRLVLTMTGGAPGTSAGDSLKTLQTTGYGAFAYTALPLDFSPAFVLKLKGLSTNRTGKATKWHVRVYALRGIPQKVSQ